MRASPVIKGLFAGEDLRIGNDWLKKLLLLAVTSGIATILFFPTLTFFGYTYEPGEVAFKDIKSPVEIASGEFSVRKGETVVREGQIITEADLRKFDLIESTMREKRSFLPALGFFAFTAVFITAVYQFASRNIRKFSTAPKDLLLMALVFVCVLLITRFSEIAVLVMKEVVPAPEHVYRYAIPVAVGPMLVRLLLNSETALVYAAFSSVMAGVFMGGSVEMTAYSLMGGVSAAMGVRHCTHRTIVVRAGLVLGAVNSATLLSLAVVKGGSTLSEPFLMVLAAFVNGVVTAILAIGIAPVLESAFQYTTDIKLLELSRMDHPLLKDLAVKAPGTYHHSLVIGTLVEAAAESINANPLLARVAAYYHDIGKIKMPAYFIENMSGDNRHDRLAPSMSALIITKHVKEGVELARAHRLGTEIMDVISQHHGTSLITFFYQKARNADGEGEAAVSEEDYRYPGPKPQTKEAGLVMLADAIEAASKTLDDPTADRLNWLTQKIVNKIFTDGQLDECELTLKDLHLITRSFNRVFAGIYHQRIDYPEAQGARAEAEIESGGHGRGNGGEGGPKDGKKGRGGGLKRLGLH
jgi:putative nucleotidyltransferase with HDIG domain